MLNVYRKIIGVLVVCLVVIVVNSCTIINPKEQVPTYIHIDSFQFQGLATHSITSVVVYYNNNPVGSYDLPVTFPIIANGTGTLLITPGIAANGQNDKLTPYPFYKSDTVSFTAQPGSIVTVTPKTDYVAAAKFLIISDFEYGQIKMSKSAGNIPITVVTDPSLRFEGNGTGSILLSAVGDSSVDSTNNQFEITPGAAFIEFDYKTAVPFALGMQAYLSQAYTSGQYYLAGVNPNDHWQKFYLNVTGYINQYPASYYSFFIKTVGQSTGRLLIDNIKLVTF